MGTHSGVADAELDKQIKAELQQWFGPAAADYELLRIYHIPFAQPNQVGSLYVFKAREMCPLLTAVCGVMPIMVHVHSFCTQLCLYGMQRRAFHVPAFFM